MVKRLTVREVQTISQPGLYSDGDGLYLQVTSPSSKTWIYRYQLRGRRRDLGLGSCKIYSLAIAREKAFEARRKVKEGIDPIEERRTTLHDDRITIDFREASGRYIVAKSPEWKNAKHKQQWTNTIAKYCTPIIGSISVNAINTELVLKCLEPIWREKPETATRIRSRIEIILNWAKVKGYRNGENPARWKGHLDQLLPSKPKFAAVRSHASMPYASIPTFMTKLQERSDTACYALTFLILTASRTGEVRNAQWNEIDLCTASWEIPGTRMKSGRNHRIPLSKPALKILATMQTMPMNDFIFPGRKRDKPISDMSMLEVLRRQQIPFMVHGFRASFRTWVAEKTTFQDDVAEAALAHSVGNKVVAAYQRGDLFEKRCRLMDAWAEFIWT